MNLEGTLLKILNYVLFFVVFILLSIPLWLKVDTLPIRLWDESQNAINAIEMEETHNWIVRTENYVPDTFDCKPPLLIWSQVAAIKMLGTNELAIRLPSVIFGILTLITVFLLLLKMTKKKWPGLIAVLIIVTSRGFYGEHGVRFGDHESLLTLTILLFLYHLYKYSINPSKKEIYLMGFYVFLGVLCKSIYIFMLLPGAFMYLAYCKKIKVFLLKKDTYFSILITLFLISSYYFIRTYFYQPEYLYHVWHGELLPRYMNNSSTHEFRYINYWFYFKLMFKEKFELWSIIIPLTFLLPVIVRRTNKEWMFWLINASSLMMILSAGTKHYWYIIPIIPMAGGLIAITLFQLIEKYKIAGILSISLVILIGFFTYKKAYNYVLNPHEKLSEWETYGITYFLKDPIHLNRLSSNTKILLKPFSLGNGGAQEAYRFYLKKLKSDTGLDIQRTTFSALQDGDTILSHHKIVVDSLEKNYRIEMLDSFRQNTRLFVIHE